MVLEVSDPQQSDKGYEFVLIPASWAELEIVIQRGLTSLMGVFPQRLKGPASNQQTTELREREIKDGWKDGTLLEASQLNSGHLRNLNINDDN